MSGAGTPAVTTINVSQQDACTTGSPCTESSFAYSVRSSTGTSPDYASKRVKDHLHRFLTLYQQLTTKKIDEPWLGQIEQMDNIFPKLNYRLWAAEDTIKKQL